MFSNGYIPKLHAYEIRHGLTILH